MIYGWVRKLAKRPFRESGDFVGSTPIPATMHQNYYDHEESEKHYWKHINNLAYRYKFKVIYEEESILKKENGETTVIVDTTETPRNTLCWKAWLKLQNEYENGF